MALALPDWSGWLAERRVLVAAERLRGELTAARRLALAGGQVVRLCPTIDRMACETQRDWSAGWLSQK
ncbi:MAG: type IV fimbrial biogenesis protein FimT, partial [Betaproteobacteria bacterium]|nr:type IV fimbrial biogenesis protein FimT [Betaproteobacteria bacterium]